MNKLFLIVIIIIIFYVVPYRDRVALCFTDGKKCFTINQLCVLEYFRDILTKKHNVSLYNRYTYLNVLLLFILILYLILLIKYYEKLSKKIQILLICLYVILIGIFIALMVYYPLIPYIIVTVILTLYCILLPISLILLLVILFSSKIFDRSSLVALGINYNIINLIILILLIFIGNLFVFNFDGRNIISLTDLLNTVIDYGVRLSTLGTMTYPPIKIIPKTMFDSL